MKNDRSLEKECKHDLVEVTMGFRFGSRSFSPTILKCEKCIKIFVVEVGAIRDRLREMKLKERK